MTSRMEFRNYRSSAQLVHCNIHQKRYSDVPTGNVQQQSNTGNEQGLGANQIGACIMDGPKSIRNMSEISEVSEVSELSPKFEYCFYRNIANF